MQISLEIRIILLLSKPMPMSPGRMKKNLAMENEVNVKPIQDCFLKVYYINLDRSKLNRA